MELQAQDKNIIKCPEDLEDALRLIVTQIKTIKHIKPNYPRGIIAFILESEQEARKMFDIKHIHIDYGTLPVTCRWAKQENFNYGIIKGIIPPRSEEEKIRRTQKLKQRLADQGAPVNEIMWLKKRMQNEENSESEIRETNAIRLEFKDEPPKEVYLGYIRYEVFDYVPEVTQCYNCQGFGHVAKHCHTTIPTCVQCGYKGHRKTENKCRPPGKIRCANCYGKHKAWSKKCPYYLKEVEAIKIRGRAKTTIHLARNMAEDSFPTLNTRTENLAKLQEEQEKKKRNYSDAAKRQSKSKSPDRNKKKRKNKKNNKKKNKPNNDIEKIVAKTVASFLQQILTPLSKIMIEAMTIPGDVQGKIHRVSEVIQESISKLSPEQDDTDSDYQPEDSESDSDSHSDSDSETESTDNDYEHFSDEEISLSNIIQGRRTSTRQPSNWIQDFLVTDTHTH